MKKVFVLVFTALVVVVALAGASDAEAACPTPIGIFGQIGYQCGTAYCYIVSPGLETSASLQHTFWNLSTGNPALGLGDDVGSLASTVFTQKFGPAYDYYMACSQATGSACTWNVPGIDGCFEGNTAPGHANPVMAWAVGDVDASGNSAFFAVTAVEQAGGQFNFSNAASNLNLIPLPSPALSGGSPVDALNTSVTVACPDLTAGFQSDGTVLANEVILGCTVYQQERPAADTVGPNGAGSRNVGGWVAIGNVANASSGAVTTTCTGDASMYLAIGPQLDSGMVLDVVSANSNRVACGPTVAQPSDRDFKVIPRDRAPKGARRDN